MSGMQVQNIAHKHSLVAQSINKISSTGFSFGATNQRKARVVGFKMQNGVNPEDPATKKKISLLAGEEKRI